MKYHQIKKSQHGSLGDNELILFFNGWGMDENPFLKMAPPTIDVLIVSDYSSFDNIEELFAYLNNYKEIKLISWSMGVWAAYHIFSKTDRTFFSALAINGTLQPIHLMHGIDPILVAEMCTTFSENVRNDFYQRMCRKQLSQFQECLPTRTLENQLQELSVLLEVAPREVITPSSLSFYDKILISTQDFIIPTAHQKQFWQSVETVLVAAPHFPFWLWSNFEECLSYCGLGTKGLKEV